MPQIILPSGYQVEILRLRQQLDEAHLAFWREREAREPQFVVENIRFRHDPKWSTRFWSIQSAHSGNHWIWKATRVFIGISGQMI